MFDVKGIGKRIKDTRENTKQEECANKIDISRAALSSYENGGRKMDIETLYNICVLFGVSSDYLLGLSSSPTIDGLSYQLRITRKLLEIGESSKHSINANVGSDGDIILYVHDKRIGKAVVDSFYTDEHEDEREVFVWLNEWAETIREERDRETD